MKQMLILTLTLCLLLTGCGGSTQEATVTNYVDTFHQQVGSLTLDITPPETWPETACAYEIAYCHLEREKLEATLLPELTTEQVNLKDEETDPDYYKVILRGSDGMAWTLWEDVPLPSSQAEYTYCGKEGCTISRDFQSEGLEQLEAVSQIAVDFLSGIGLDDVEFQGYTRESDTVLLHYGYGRIDDIPMFDNVMAKDGWYPFTPSYFDVAVSEGTVQYADILYPYQVVRGEASQESLSPEQAVECVIEWYTDFAYGDTYEYDSMTLCYGALANQVVSGETTTAPLRPYWVFGGTHGDSDEIIAVDAISGDIIMNNIE